jgi:hypothetical protein
MKPKLDRIISIATLVALLVAIGLLLRRPAQEAQPAKASAGIAAAAPSSSGQSFSQRVAPSEPPARTDQSMQQAPQSQAVSGYSPAPQPVPTSAASQASKSGPHVNSEEISAAISQMLGGAGLTPDSDVGSGTPNIKDQKVTYDGDTVHGQFLTEIGGKDVWVTISGHMGQKDGYATFDPTEFKVGDMDVPVALVNPALQRKLAEERDRLKISEPAK